MKNTIFTGAGVAIITPMLPDGSIDYAGLGKNIDDQIENGTDAIIICGTTGESSTMTDEEHRKCIEFAVQHTHNRVPVIAGTGSNDTKYAISLSQEAQEMGCNGLLIVTPYYNKATQKGLIAHYTAIANAVPETPLIMYNVPSRTGCNIQPATAAYLAKNVKNIVGIKEATGDLSQIAKMMSLADGQLELYSGNDDQVLPILSLGGLGVISVLSNVAPKFTHDMVMKYFDGDTKGATEDQLKALPLINALFSEVNPIPVKTAMNLMGMNVGPLRMPLCEMEEDTKAALAKEIEKFDVGLGNLLEVLKEDDLLIITADHGNDPTYTGTDHTREYTPFIAYSKSMKENGRLEDQDTFAVIGATIADNFGVTMPEGTIGTSLLSQLKQYNWNKNTTEGNKDLLWCFVYNLVCILFI